MEWVFSLDNINRVAKDFWKITEGSNVFAFHGEMGAGKTTFIHELCTLKGIREVAGSPTFSIINEYGYTENGIEKMICHIDLFRIKDGEEAIRAGVEDCLYSNGICLVEWPEKAPAIFPDGTVHVFIELADAVTRRLKIGNN